MFSEETWIGIGACITIVLLFVAWFVRYNFGWWCCPPPADGPVTNQPPRTGGYQW